MMPNKITFITGGQKSGKSDFALKLVEEDHDRLCYVATALTLDDEMKERVRRHKEERSSRWNVIEESVNIKDAVMANKDDYDVFLIDCMTLWMSNLMMSTNDDDILEMVHDFINTVRVTKAHVIIISNEVGNGIIPENKVARRFVDLSGKVNQMIAQGSDEVFLMTVGISQKIK